MDLNKNSQEKRDIFRRNNYIFDGEYKLLKDAWKKIINNKNFKEDIAGSSHRVIIFCLSVLGLIDNDLNNKFFKKYFSFIVMGENDTSDYLKLSKQNISKNINIKRNISANKNIRKIGYKKYINRKESKDEFNVINTEENDNLDIHTKNKC